VKEKELISLKITTYRKMLKEFSKKNNNKNQMRRKKSNLMPL
jgi:hypothetical protein